MLLSIWQDSSETLCRILELFFLTMILSSPVLTAIQEYWNGEPFPSPEDLSNPGIKPRSPTLREDCLLSKPTGEAQFQCQDPQIPISSLQINDTTLVYLCSFTLHHSMKSTSRDKAITSFILCHRSQSYTAKSPMLQPVF